MMNPRRPNLGVYLIFGILMAIFCIYYIYFHEASWKGRLASRTGGQAPRSQDLKGLLQSATRDDNSVIITTVTEEWAAPNSFLDIFLESFHISKMSDLLRHLVIVALDHQAFQRCKSIHIHCYFLNMEEGGEDEKKSLVSSYWNMRWRQLKFLQYVLKIGYSFIYTDLDVLWLRRPFLQMKSASLLIVSTDEYHGDSLNARNIPNGGFVYARSCDQMIAFYDYWYRARKENPQLDEQKVLDSVLNVLAVKLRLIIQFLDTDYFSGFCQPSRNFDKVCTMHANCCSNSDAKLNDLRAVLQDWRNYTSLSAQGNNVDGIHWTVPDKCKRM